MKKQAIESEPKKGWEGASLKEHATNLRGSIAALFRMEEPEDVQMFIERRKARFFFWRKDLNSEEVWGLHAFSYNFGMLVEIQPVLGKSGPQLKITMLLKG